MITSHLSLNPEGLWGTTDDFATSFLHFSLFCTAVWDFTNSRPVHSHDVVFPPFPLSALSSSPFHCALLGFGQTCLTGDMTMPLQFASLYDCLLDLGTDFFIGNMVFV